MSHQPSVFTSSLRPCAAIVPVWQPELGCLTLVHALTAAGFGTVAVVDDGSDAQHAAFFAELSQLPQVTLLRHPVNHGKGRAIKTGFNHILSATPDIEVVVTADADGQHRVPDIVAVAERALHESGQVVLGSRAFGREVPFRSKLGNCLTRAIFAFITGTRIGDTQTGLRAFPRNLLPQLMLLDGERYEYEMTVLTHICQQVKPIEIPIETVYADGNRASHFDPVWDSMRIYFVLLRFYFSGLSAAALDCVGFAVAFASHWQHLCRRGRRPL